MHEDHHDHEHGHAHHHHDHDQGHHHGHRHSHGPAGQGHNHPHDLEHLHSHLHGQPDRADELQHLTAAFVDGFRSAEDKTSYLKLAGIPFERTGEDGLKMHLVDAAIVSNWQVGTASPAFGSRELVYLPFPGEMVRARETMALTYVSLTSREDVDIAVLLADRMT